MTSRALLTVILLLTLRANGQEIVFRDRASEQGLRFVHDHGGSGEKYYVETMGSGVCLFDYDGDGDLDAYFPQGRPLPGWDKPGVTLTNELFRNDAGRWTDVTAEAGVGGGETYGIGCACADTDNDGDSDLYVTNFGADLFYRNNGDGTFTDATAAAGIDNRLWGSSAVFFDADNDGWLDLYVANYVDYSLEKNPWCGERRSGRRAYCDPDVFTGVPDKFYHNNGDGTFADWTERSGVGAFRGKGLGAVPVDIEDDGDLDVYVANDKVMNLLFVNDGAGRFQENALFAGVGFDENGRAQAGMGVDAGDVNRDGRMDLFVTNFSGESNTLYQNEGAGFFTDVTFAAGLGEPSLDYLGFGTRFLDVDLDGWQDILAVNGHVIDNISYFNRDYTHAQRKQLFLNQQGGKFRELSPPRGGDLNIPTVGRGAAFGDLDSDGDTDVIVSNNNGPANLLLREGKPTNHWIGLELEGKSCNRDAIGAKVAVESASGKQIAWVNPGASYLASNDKRLVFGLGQDKKVVTVTVRWPGGMQAVFRDLKVDRYHKLVQGGEPSSTR